MYFLAVTFTHFSELLQMLYEDIFVHTIVITMVTSEWLFFAVFVTQENQITVVNCA